jgi:hypothetical protein
MKSIIKILILLSFALSVSCALTETQKAQMLKAHNDYRSMEGAANMLIMTWCDDLATQAQAYADTCSGSKHSDALDYGENLYSSLNQGVNMDKAVKAWFDEKTWTSWPTDPVLSMEAFNKGTGHYTQVVWAKSNFLGCGQTNCASKNSWDNSIVCQYKEKGNILNQTLWIKGEPCSQCPAGYDKCIDNMCAGGSTDSCSGKIDTSKAEAVTPDSESIIISKFCKKTRSFDMVKTKSLKKCENCIYSEHCDDDRYCCPYMKKCVISSTESCSVPVAKCSNCYSDLSIDPSKCNCNDSDFPENWMDCNAERESGNTSNNSNSNNNINASVTENTMNKSTKSFNVYLSYFASIVVLSIYLIN